MRSHPVVSNRARRLRFLATLAFALVFIAAGAIPNPPQFEFEWGTGGTGPGQFDLPISIALSPSNEVYVADRGNRRIQKFTESGTFIHSWGSSGTGNGQFRVVDYLDVSGDGAFVYVTDALSARVQKFDASGNYLAKWGTPGSAPGQFNAPKGVAVDDAGNVYVVDSGNDRVQKFDGAGNLLLVIGGTGTEPGRFRLPWDVAAAGNTILVTDLDNFRVQVFDGSGGFLAAWPTQKPGEGGPFSGLSVDSRNGKVAVTDPLSGRAHLFLPDGTYDVEFGQPGGGPGQFGLPVAVALRSNGGAYVSDLSNRVLAFTAPGVAARPTTWGRLKADHR